MGALPSLTRPAPRLQTAMEIADRRLQKMTEKAAARGAHGPKPRPLTKAAGAGAAAAAGAGAGAGAGAAEGAEEAVPTSLISTAAVERRAHQDGEVDVHTDASAAPGAAQAAGQAGQAGQAAQAARPHPGLRFMPTEAWLAGARPEQALNTLMRLLRHLVPQVRRCPAWK